MADKNPAVPFNPYTQPFTLFMADGVTPFQVDIAALDDFVSYNNLVCVNYGSQVGASIIMLLVVALVTKPSKRRSPIFALNVLSLILSMIRSLLQTLYWVGPFTEAYAYFSGDFSGIPRSAFANSIASLVMTLLFLTTVECSLVLQTQVVCTTLTPLHRRSILLLSATITIFTIGLRFGLTVQNSEAIISLQTTYSLRWLASAALIMETLSIWFFCLIFIAKLGVTLWQRKKMGLKQWGPMQIICIMGGCTMIIPSIFAILEYFPESTFPEAGSLALTLVAIFLPLSSIWAAAAIDGQAPMYVPDTNKKLASHSTGHTSSRGDSTFDRKGSLGAMISPTTLTTTIRGDGSDMGDDVEALGVTVHRSYSIQSGRLVSADRD